MTYELIYPDGQESVEASLFEAHVIAKQFVRKCVEHEKKTYIVRKALFDPTRGIVLTSTTEETFVHVRLRKSAKRIPPPPRVEAKQKEEKPQIGPIPKCACGLCATCKNREYSRERRAPEYNPRKYTRKTQPPSNGRGAKRQKPSPPKPPGGADGEDKSLGHGNPPLTCTCGKCRTCYHRKYYRDNRRTPKAKTPRNGRSKAKGQKPSPPKPTAQTNGIPEENVRKGIAGMFKSGMSFLEIAEIFDVTIEAVETLIREAL